jgi:hypothetical protein
MGSDCISGKPLEMASEYGFTLRRPIQEMAPATAVNCPGAVTQERELPCRPKIPVRLL